MATFNIRPSDLLLDRVLNPTRDADIGSATPALIIEACGIIPDFFAHACMAADPLTLDEIAHHMARRLPIRRLSLPGGGSLTPAGVYQSSLDDDQDMSPLARFVFDTDTGGFECFVYHYGIAAIRDRATRETKMARFD